MNNLDKPKNEKNDLYLNIGYALKPQTPRVINTFLLFLILILEINKIN